MTNTTIIEHLFHSVEKWFSRPEEISARCREVTKGLDEQERRLLENLSPASEVLDMGCAAGRVAFSLAQDGHHVTGTDISEHLVKQAQTLAAEQGLNVHFQTCPPNQNLFASDSFDAVLLFKVYCYVPQRQRRIGWLHDIAHVVRPGGFLFLSQYIIDTSVGSYGPIIEELGQRFPALVDELEEGDGFSLPSENDPTVSFIHFFMERDLLGELRASPFQIIDSWRDELLCYCVLQK